MAQDPAFHPLVWPQSHPQTEIKRWSQHWNKEDRIKFSQLRLSNQFLIPSQPHRLYNGKTNYINIKYYFIKLTQKQLEVQQSLKWQYDHTCLRQVGCTETSRTSLLKTHFACLRYKRTTQGTKTMNFVLIWFCWFQIRFRKGLLWVMAAGWDIQHSNKHVAAGQTPPETSHAQLKGGWSVWMGSWDPVPQSIHPKLGFWIQLKSTEMS